MIGSDMARCIDVSIYSYFTVLLFHIHGCHCHLFPSIAIIAFIVRITDYISTVL